MTALRAEGLQKSFRHQGADAPRTFRRWVEGGWRTRPRGEMIRALDDVSLEVAPGQMLGVIGRNGAGKSTLLRLLGGVMQPDRGRVIATAPVNGLLALNTGMHPELTGRENIVINGVLSGLLREEVRARSDSIIAFAEMQDHIDDPVRTYSSGMKLRLGFSVAVHVEPKILLIDEVLAVGDIEFQKKCLRRIAEFKENGCAIVLISHDLGTVRRVCDRVLWLDRGQVRAIGAPESVVSAYEGESSGVTSMDGWGEVAGVTLRDPAGAGIETLAPGAGLTVGVALRALRPISRPQVGITIADASGHVCFDADSLADGVDMPDLTGNADLSVEIARLDLTPGHYTVSVSLRPGGSDPSQLSHWSACPLTIEGDARPNGMLNPPRHWRIAGG
ncbi:ABC transporter ATP-binding protein [Defluviimonas sp. D31]|uniref:ABC transporter ATP-binding protein n=1 Tax=Defluviimonas sp. D31 TaxID=3083253 RepID=UPI00296E8CFF|nr:ABC transporter ATP-binding protein [Defluviimonas sp. D31]MDW4549989.1 ABC transporter ATP-binding protein [Defluviimonas sp. D31]